MDLSGLSNSANAVSALGNLILVSPQNAAGYQPQSKVGTDGSVGPELDTILFHYEGEQSATFESEITDHFIEDNTAIQDQIALKPIIITTHGYIGELNNVVPPALQALKKIAETLTVIDALQPVISESALLAYQQAATIYQSAKTVVNTGVQAWNAITGGKAQTEQSKVFQQFYGYWKDRVLFTVQTPWANLNNMAIMSLRAVQDETTKMITDFEVTFKQLNFATTETISDIDPSDFQSRLFFQGSPSINLGTQVLKPSSTSFSSQLVG